MKKQYFSPEFDVYNLKIENLLSAAAPSGEDPINDIIEKDDGDNP